MYNMNIISSIPLLLVGAVCVHGRIHGIASQDLGLPVQVSVTCKGLHMNRMESISKMVVAQVLEEAYENVKETNDSQSALTFTEIDPPNAHNGLLDAAGLDKEEKMIGRNNNNNIEDEDHDNNDWVFDAFWRCGSLCPKPKDDDFTAGSLRTDHIKSWENTFMTGLIDTRRGEFRAIEHCNIGMNTVTDTESK